MKGRLNPMVPVTVVAGLLVLAWIGWNADLGAGETWQSRVFVVAAAATVLATLMNRWRAARVAGLVLVGVAVGCALVATDWSRGSGLWMVWISPALLALAVRSLVLPGNRPGPAGA